MNLQLSRPLLEESLPSLTLQFALVPEGGNTFPASASLCIQLVEGAHAATWQPTCLCLMTLTFGSIGLSKATVHTYQTRLTSAEGVSSLIPFDDYDGWLLSLLLFHVPGQGIMWRWLYVGTWMTVRDKQPLEQMLAGCTYVSLVLVQLWRLLVSHNSVSLKAALLGGATIPVELMEQMREQGIRYFCGYGLTGLASTVCAKEAGSLADVSSPPPDRGVKTANNEVWLQAANIAEGYWHNERRAPLVNDEGWYATCGHGEVYNGKLTIVGRLDNLFSGDGEDIQPEEVERVIAIHPAVLQVFIVPVADKGFGHRPVTVVEYGQQNVDLGEQVKDKLTHFQQPVHWLALPPELKNGGIKISRQALRKWVEHQQQLALRLTSHLCHPTVVNKGFIC